MPPDETGDRARLVGTNHVAMEVGDVEAALEFYRGLFAFELRGRLEGKAFVDMGDQFVALVETDGAEERDALDRDAGERVALDPDTRDRRNADDARHVGFVVDDADLVASRLEALHVERLDTSGLDFHDPWGNRIQVVEYGAVQFTKTAHILKGMGLGTLEKTDSALEELAEKGMVPTASDDRSTDGDP